MKPLLLILLLAALLFAAWDLYLANHPLPHATVLTSKDGQSVDVDIVSATSQEVFFRLPSNDMVYDWPVADLDLVSRYKALRLIQSSKRNQQDQSTTPLTVEGKRNEQRTSTYIENLQHQIAENEKRVAILHDRLNEERSRRPANSTLNMTANERSLYNQIQKLNNEIEAYNLRIAEEIRNHR